eukprot:COSAG06_NODE_1719_length_8590_cov_18.960311_9_plen_98_part_00
MRFCTKDRTFAKTGTNVGEVEKRRLFLQDDEGGAQELLADLFALVHAASQQFSDEELRQGQWAHAEKGQMSPRKPSSASSRKGKGKGKGRAKARGKK